jgi:hypothetical protein
LRQLAHGQVKALEYSRYDINKYHFRTVKLEASRPLAATSNKGVVTSVEDARGVSANYYVVLKKNYGVYVQERQRKVVFF